MGEALAAADLVLAPEMMLTEVVNALWRLQRAGELEGAGLQQRFERAVALVDHIEPDRTLQAEALALATHLDHPVYDCLLSGAGPSGGGGAAQRRSASVEAGCQGVAVSTGAPLPPHEVSLLNLVIDKAHHQLGWSPRWDFATTVERTVGWFRQVQEGQESALELCEADLARYQEDRIP
jgi:hypothetical protein